MIAESDPLLDSAEVAAILGVEAATVRRYKWQGILPADVTKGRTPLWRQSTAERFKATRRGPGRPSTGKD